MSKSGGRQDFGVLRHPRRQRHPPPQRRRHDPSDPNHTRLRNDGPPGREYLQKKGVQGMHRAVEFQGLLRVNGRSGGVRAWRRSRKLRVVEEFIQRARLACGNFRLGLAPQPVEPAGRRILIHLPIPERGVSFRQPVGNLAKLLGRQIRDFRLELFDLGHDLILAIPRACFKPPFREGDRHEADRAAHPAVVSSLVPQARPPGTGAGRVPCRPSRRVPFAAHHRAPALRSPRPSAACPLRAGPDLMVAGENSPHPATPAPSRMLDIPTTGRSPPLLAYSPTPRRTGRARRPHRSRQTSRNIRAESRSASTFVAGELIHRTGTSRTR